jgi:hypothetical protein
MTSRADIAHAVALTSQHSPHHVPLYRAAHQGLIGIVQPTRVGIVSAAQVRRMRGQSWLILIGDDDGLDTGPDGWACARRVLGWARRIVIHGAAGLAEHYAGAAAATMVVRRLVLIECTSARVNAWAEAAKRDAPNVIVQCLVPAGGVHPVPVNRRKMQ